ncbi:hypothetical protein [Morganella morganii]|uniref:hypothetical protein n=1 Tax=Morganella morganii TaxID=582 RepID=UPI000B3FAC07|nr:hypothetical protein [Morganella morganii]MBM7210919.1 hypothetical protein [Morganella morganii]MBN4019654.1 hypothetical protein [Morganella morganii]MBW4180765.1 hypothetical protein [Morganella morganii]MDF5913473.1 hypothetical protein [Morganella morganii]OVF57310.1 hypothetical protein B5724_04440 [Morganella morganii]
MADIKIPFKYCRISRAADFLNCRVEDLLTLGLENKININLMLDSVSSIMIMDMPLTEAEKWRTTLSYSYHLCTGANAISEYSSFKFDILSVDSDDNPIFKPYFIDDDGITISCIGRAYGLWRLTRCLDDLINYGVAYVECTNFVPCSPQENSPFIQLITGVERNTDDNSIEDDCEDDDYCESADSGNRITDKDVWITGHDIRRLLDCDGDYFKMPSLNEIKNVNSELQVAHPVINRHAKNREEILIAAIRFKEEQPNVFLENCIKKDGTINYTEFSRQLLERPFLFPDGDSPMKSTEAIIKTLKKAFKQKSQATPL